MSVDTLKSRLPPSLSSKLPILCLADLYLRLTFELVGDPELRDNFVVKALLTPITGTSSTSVMDKAQFLLLSKTYPFDRAM